MKHFDEQTAKDLEFDQIRDWLVEFCRTDTVAQRMSKLQPLANKQVEEKLNQVHELQLIRNRGLSFPRMEFQELKKEVKLLGIYGAVLELEAIIKILDATRFVNDLFKFFNEYYEEYDALRALLSPAHSTKVVEKEITKILDRRMKVKDDASEELYRIRQRMNQCKVQINRNFDKALRAAKKSGFIEDLEESFIGNRRVLSIVSSHKRKVDGNVLGSSKSGGLTYIEPESNLRLNAEYDQLLDDEYKELRKIFLELTNFMRGHLSLIKGYQKIICAFDEVNAKELLARKFNAVKPQIEEKSILLSYKDAYHPILTVKNKEIGLKTIPQSFYLKPESRILVISGPNAGGKSITLKTVGLIQLMFQSGLLVPLSTQSKLGFFDHILSDIGDNQSIANQLSTYSYRLQRMNSFLDKLDPKSMLLLDEFGTGSDPELGGALAEVFFEEIYEAGCFGVITTHYSNIKLRAAQMDEAVNANMLFNRSTLQPEYQLEVGQPGSSFTFEVAKMNGIPNEMLKKAKAKVNRQKIQMDQLISDLQKDRSILKKLKKENYEATQSMQESREEYDQKSAEFKERLSRYQKTAEENNHFINYGKKLEQFIKEWPQAKKKQAAYLEELKKYILMEQAKVREAKKKARLKAANEQKGKGANKKSSNRQNTKKKVVQKPIEIGSKVKLKNSRQVGEVVAIDGKEVTLIVGQLKAKVKREGLVVV